MYASLKKSTQGKTRYERFIGGNDVTVKTSDMQNKYTVYIIQFGTNNLQRKEKIKTLF